MTSMISKLRKFSLLMVFLPIANSIKHHFNPAHIPDARLSCCSPIWPNPQLTSQMCREAHDVLRLALRCLCVYCGVRGPADATQLRTPSQPSRRKTATRSDLQRQERPTRLRVRVAFAYLFKCCYVQPPTLTEEL